MIDEMRLNLKMNNGKVEYVMCAATWYKNFEAQAHLPFNIGSGVVLCGWRHGNIIGQMSALIGLRSVTNGENSTGEYKQGFLTTKNRFLTRSEALVLVKENGQLTQPLIGGELSSEDLW